MFDKSEEVYSQHLVNVINRLSVGEGQYELQYALGVAERFYTHESYVTVKERFELMDEFYHTGKLILKKSQLYTGKEEEEVIEPLAIRFLPIETHYVKTDAVIQIPSVLEPRLVWHRADFDRWFREIIEVRYEQELSQSEQFKAQVEIAQRYGMKLKEE